MTEWNAPAYACIAGLQEAMAAEVLALLKLKGSEKVLDLGCGNGNVTAEIAARVPDGLVVGVDASTDMISFAASHYSPSAHPNLHFETCDIRRISLREKFDLVVSFNALHWIPDQDEALRAIRSALKSDGLAQLRLVPDGERKGLETVIEETRKSQGGAYTSRASTIHIFISRPNSTRLWLNETACMWMNYTSETKFGTSTLTRVSPHSAQ
jgi:trans-aconitate 2-methyltransferase